MVAALLLRASEPAWSEHVHLHVPRTPTVAFTRRDVRSPGIEAAVALARDAGFETVVRAPGGRMVAYDEGAVVIDHVTRSVARRAAGDGTFAVNAERHAAVLRSLGVDARVGEVAGEYCPGEFSVNVGGRFKVVGSAQRITSSAALFSTVVQVVTSARVRDVIVAVSEALGYALEPTTIGALADVRPGLDPQRVVSALADDYRQPAGTTDTALDPGVAALASTARTTDDLLDVDAWARSATAS